MFLTTHVVKNVVNRVVNHVCDMSCWIKRLLTYIKIEFLTLSKHFLMSVHYRSTRPGVHLVSQRRPDVLRSSRDHEGTLHSMRGHCDIVPASQHILGRPVWIVLNVRYEW